MTKPARSFKRRSRDSRSVEASRLADTTYHWHDDAVHLTRESDIRASFAAIMKGQFDPKEMIDKMIEVIGADDGLHRNVWPPSIETLIKQVQDRVWTLRTRA